MQFPLISYRILKVIFPLIDTSDGHVVCVGGSGVETLGGRGGGGRAQMHSGVLMSAMSVTISTIFPFP